MVNLSDKINAARSKPPIMRFEWFTLWLLDGHNLWLEMDGGEGMQVSKQEFMALVNKIWKRL